MKKLFIVFILLISQPAFAQIYMNGFRSPDGNIYTSTYDSQQSSHDSQMQLEQQNQIQQQQQAAQQQYYQQQQQIEEMRYQRQLDRQALGN